MEKALIRGLFLFHLSFKNMRQAEGFTGQQLGGANFFKLIQDACRVRMVVQQKFDHRLYFLLYQQGLGQGLVGAGCIGRVVLHVFCVSRVLLVVRHVGAGFGSHDGQASLPMVGFLQSMNQQIQVEFEVLGQLHQCIQSVSKFSVAGQTHS